jgi:hypothetical protein
MELIRLKKFDFMKSGFEEQSKPGRQVDGRDGGGVCCCCSTRSASSKVKIFTLSGSFSPPITSRPRSMSKSY